MQIKKVSGEPITQGSAQVEFNLSDRTFSVISAQATYKHDCLSDLSAFFARALSTAGNKK